MDFGIIEIIKDLVANFLTHEIVFAPILLLILEEAGVPLPGANFVIAYTGYQVSLGHIPYLAAFIILILSDLLGASILYYLSFKYGEGLILKFEKYIDLDRKKLKMVEDKFRTYGSVAIIFGRHIPGFRIPITIFSGISSMKYKTFLISTFISVVFWIPFYLSLGQKLGPRTILLIKHNHWYLLLIILTIVISISPLLFLRKRRNRHSA